MILVCGATGTVGSELVKQLSDAGVACRALVRDAAAADWIRYPGVELTQGDFARPETLDRPLEGVDRVYLVSPPHPRQPEHEGNVIEACRRAGVGSVVKQSILNADPASPVPFCRWNGEVERMLADSGVPHVNLRPNFFMQNLLVFAEAIRDRGLIAQPLEEARVSMIDARDIAAAAVAVLTEEERGEGSTALTGPAAISFPEAAGELTVALRRPVIYMSISPAEARQELEELALPDWYVEASLALAESYRQGEAAVVTREVQHLTGRSAHSFGEFARDYAGVFAGTAPGAEEERRRAA